MNWSYERLRQEREGPPHEGDVGKIRRAFIAITTLARLRRSLVLVFLGQLGGKVLAKLAAGHAREQPLELGGRSSPGAVHTSEVFHIRI